MKKESIDFASTGYFSKTMLDYLSGADALKPFYKYRPEFSQFKQVIADKKQQPIDRDLLADTLLKQYSGYETTQAVKDSIELLRKETTFTITTAHQPNIFTGYLYYIYKIISAVNLAEQLKAAHAQYDFVPVYWMGGEDHDFDEISQVNLYGETLQWQNDQGGPVGRMDTSAIAPLIEQVQEKLGNQPYADELVELLKKAYVEHKTLSQATRYLVNTLFGKYGVVVLVQDDVAFKQVLKPVIKTELLEQFSYKLLQSHLPKLEQAGYGQQATPREINLFYLQAHARNRIEQTETGYQVVDTDINWSEEELLKEVEEHPEHFSPNVILRPLYQEMLLPNLAYVGGGGELAYWLQLKPEFERFGINYPMLVLRNSLCLVEGNTARKMEKLDLSVENVFQDTEALIKKHVKQNTEQELSLSEEQQAIESIYDQLKAKAKAVDPTLEQTVEGQKQGQLNTLKGLEAKLLRAEKKNFDVATNQIRSIKDRLFPEGNLQERHDNFMPYYARYGESYINDLKDAIDPLEKKFTVLFLD